MNPIDLPKHLLDWEDLYNARDLGGLCSPGGRIRPEALVRSDSLPRLTAAGRAALLDHGIRTVIDLRSPGQAQADRYPFMAVDSGRDAPAYRNLPLENRADPACLLVDRAPTSREKYRLMLDAFGANVAAIVRTVAAARPGGVLIHCQAGKDRTGVAIALLLAVAGVAYADIDADYAASAAYLQPLYDRLVTEAGDDPQKQAELPPAPAIAPHTMLDVLTGLDAQYGGVPGYLHAIGVPADDLARIRRRLIEEDAPSAIDLVKERQSPTDNRRLATDQ